MHSTWNVNITNCRFIYSTRLLVDSSPRVEQWGLRHRCIRSSAPTHKRNITTIINIINSNISVWTVSIAILLWLIGRLPPRQILIQVPSLWTDHKKYSKSWKKSVFSGTFTKASQMSSWKQEGVYMLSLLSFFCNIQYLHIEHWSGYQRSKNKW